MNTEEKVLSSEAIVIVGSGKCIPEMALTDACISTLVEGTKCKSGIGFLSDSQTAIMAVSSSLISFPAVWECYLRLKKLGEKPKVTLIWVPPRD